MYFVEICNVYVGKMIIKAANRIFNSDKICRSYSDLNFGVTFLEHRVNSRINSATAHRFVVRRRTVIRYTITSLQLKATTNVFLVCKFSVLHSHRRVRAITPFKVIQGHRFWYQSKVHMRRPISDLVIVTYFLSCTVSEI